MRQAITTKYIGPTNYRPARVKATAASGLSVTVSWDHALNVDDNHTAAARALAVKLKWGGLWVGGGGEVGNVYVLVTDEVVGPHASAARASDSYAFEVTP